MRIKQSRPIPNGARTACVIRYGAYGDAVLCSPVFRQLKKDGYYVFFNCTEKSYEVQCKNPNVDCFMILDTNEVPPAELDAYWKKMEGAFSKVINLSGSIEESLLAVPWKPEYALPKEERHKLMNRNYTDETMAIAGYPDMKGEKSELFFKKREEDWAKAIRARYPGFLVVYSLSGSSSHKTYPFADSVVQAIIDGIPEATVILVGEAGCKNIIDPHPRIIDLSGEVNIRKSFILTRIADLVITTETSVANAVGCFSTPKIVLLSHSSNENLTKYFENCHVVEPPVSCFPCHKIHYTEKTCPTKFWEVDGAKVGGPVCVALLRPELLLEKVELVYDKWLETHPQFVHPVDNPI